MVFLQYVLFHDSFFVDSSWTFCYNSCSYIVDLLDELFHADLECFFDQKSYRKLYKGKILFCYEYVL